MINFICGQTNCYWDNSTIKFNTNNQFAGKFPVLDDVFERSKTANILTFRGNTTPEELQAEYTKNTKNKFPNLNLNFYKEKDTGNYEDLIYDMSENVLYVNTEKLINKTQWEKFISTTSNLINITRNMPAKIIDRLKELENKSAKILDVEKDFVPSLRFFYDKTTIHAFYDPVTHKIGINIRNIKPDTDIDSEYSSILAHEVSHSKSFLDFSLMDLNNIPAPLRQTDLQKEIIDDLKRDHYQEYRNYRTNNNPLVEGSKEYERIKYHFYQFLEEKNFKTQQEYNDYYYYIFEEAKARVHESTTTKKLIDIDEIEPTKEALTRASKNLHEIRDLVFFKDTEIRNMIEKGEVKTKEGKKPLILDEATLNHLLNNNTNDYEDDPIVGPNIDLFKTSRYIFNLDLSKQQELQKKLKKNTDKKE